MKVETWLQELGLEQYAEAFTTHDVDGEILAKLTSQDLKEIGVKSVGHRRMLLDAISRLASTSAAVKSPDSYTPQHLAERIL